MKKILIFIFLFCCILMPKCDFLPPVFASPSAKFTEDEGYYVNPEFVLKSYNLLQDSEKNASKIFYKFMMKNSRKEISMLKKTSITMRYFSPKITLAIEFRFE